MTAKSDTQSQTPQGTRTHTAHETIVILDFGSQFTQLIARRVRAAKVFSVILPGDVDVERVRALRPRGIVLSGGPASVYGDNAPQLDAGVLALDVPVLGVCYGLQLLTRMLGGQVQKSREHEYGKAVLQRTATSPCRAGTPRSSSRLAIASGSSACRCRRTGAPGVPAPDRVAPTSRGSKSAK
jgi:GMP synthase-like glutamine amidotransferase